MASQKTKAKIIDTAISLFNEQGTQAISTNHITQSASISPGNFYYHFRSKEEIIRAILEQYFTDMDRSWLSEEVSPFQKSRDAANAIALNM